MNVSALSSGGYLKPVPNRPLILFQGSAPEKEDQFFMSPEKLADTLFKKKPPYMGIQPLDEGSWILIDKNYADEMALKFKLLATERDHVFQAEPGSEKASKNVLNMLVAHLPKIFKTDFQTNISNGKTWLSNKLMGEVWNITDGEKHPLEVAGRLVQEDLCIMQRGEDGTYRMTAANLCFPNGWSLQEKMEAGGTLEALHQEVPGYMDKIARGVEKLIGRLGSGQDGVEKVYTRANWGIQKHNSRFRPPGLEHSMEEVEITEGNAGSQLWVRNERQTLRNIPDSEDVLFTIKTYLYPAEAYARHEALRTGLITALKETEEKILEYKGIKGFKEPLLKYLENYSAV